MTPDGPVLVLGSGVSGLTTAVTLQQAGHEVTIWTAALPGDTTSAVAAAIWYPYRAYPVEQVLPWSRRTYQVLASLDGVAGTGVALRDGVELFRAPVEDPWWRSAVQGFGRVPAGARPDGYGDGYAFKAPVVEMPVYLDWLLARFTAAGGRLQQRVASDLDDACAAARAVVNCTGLGARALVGDSGLVGIRGQVVRVANPGLDGFWLDEEHPEGITYVVARSRDVVLGGTAEPGRDSLEPDPVTAAAIMRRATALQPRLEGATVLAHAVGLRPGRRAIRLERVDRPDGSTVVHNYGHGGAGVTLSWGCAEAVRDLLG